MGVAEGVDVEDVGVGGREEHVLHHGGDHVPGVEHEEGSDQPDAVGGDDGDDECVEELVTEEVGEGEAILDVGLDGNDGDVDGCEHQVAVIL